MTFGQPKKTQLDGELTGEAFVPAVGSDRNAPPLIVRPQLFLTLGYQHPTRDKWRILVQGRIVRQAQVPLGKRLMLRGLRRILRAAPEAFQSELFRSRIEGFINPGVSRRKVRIGIGPRFYALRRRTRRSGLFSGKLDIAHDHLQMLLNPPAFDGKLLPLRYVDAKFSECAGYALLAPREGLSIITDIDDTIRETCVVSKREMLRRSFLMPFEAIPGMADIYQRWAEQGALFHYVSSSPWQMYGPVADFCMQGGFPIGSMHLRWFRLRDEMFKRWRIIRLQSKLQIIAGIVKKLKGRQFVLVGDSGERDPEFYARVAARYPDQIKMIIIRNLPERPLEGRRLNKVLQRIGPIPLVRFHHAAEIENLVLPMVK